MNLLRRISNWLEDKKIFQRERRSNEQRALSMLLYNAGLSYKKAGSFRPQQNFGMDNFKLHNTIMKYGSIF